MTTNTGIADAVAEERRWWRNLLAEAHRAFYDRDDRKHAEPDHPESTPFYKGQVCGAGDVLRFLTDEIRDNDRRAHNARKVNDGN